MPTAMTFITISKVLALDFSENLFDECIYLSIFDIIGEMSIVNKCCQHINETLSILETYDDNSKVGNIDKTDALRDVAA